MKSLTHLNKMIVSSRAITSAQIRPFSTAWGIKSKFEEAYAQKVSDMARISKVT